jgi:hypothetical protein
VREEELIAFFGRKIKEEGPLTNIMEGGGKEYVELSEESRAKISESLKNTMQSIQKLVPN